MEKVLVPGSGVEVWFVGVSSDGGKVYSSNLWSILSKAAEDLVPIVEKEKGKSK